MEYTHAGNETYIIRLERGEELLARLTDFCERENVHLASVEGIGASDHAVVGLYDIPSKTYIKHELNGPMELVSLLGNITAKDGKPYLHLHASFCGSDMVLRGGHLNECRISVTCEIFVRTAKGSVGRRPDRETGINLMDLSPDLI